MLYECCNYLFLSILTAGCFDHVVSLVFSYLRLAFTIHRAYQPIHRDQLLSSANSFGQLCDHLAGTPSTEWLLLFEYCQSSFLVRML